MKLITKILFFIAPLINCLTIGTVNTPGHLYFPISILNQTLNTELKLDSNWAWMHLANDSTTNCFPSTTWNLQACNSGKDCWNKCAIEPVTQDQFAVPYGISVQNNQLTLKYVTVGPYGTNVGSRLYVYDSLH